MYLNQHRTDLFADDVSVSIKGKHLAYLNAEMKQVMDKANEWCLCNKMFINKSKTKCMLISSNRKNNSQLSVTFKNSIIEQVTHEKVLGLYIDSNLSWKFHVEHIIKKINSLLYLFRRIKKFLDVEARILYYNSFILPHIDYCCSIWGNCSNYLLNSIFKIQKRSARLILDKTTWNSNSSQLLDELGIQTIHERIHYHKSLLMFKGVNNICPEYISSLFNSCSSMSSRVKLRSSKNNDLIIPRPKTEFFKKSLSYSGPKIWNSLDTCIKNSMSIQAFKSTYKSLIDNSNS